MDGWVRGGGVKGISRPMEEDQKLGQERALQTRCYVSDSLRRSVLNAQRKTPIHASGHQVGPSASARTKPSLTRAIFRDDVDLAESFHDPPREERVYRSLHLPRLPLQGHRESRIHLQEGRLCEPRRWKISRGLVEGQRPDSNEGLHDSLHHRMPHHTRCAGKLGTPARQIFFCF